jgi:hypothetical protein
LSILPRKKLRAFSSALFLYISFSLSAYLTYPPSSPGGLLPEKMFSQAKESFARGDLAIAYKYLLLSEDLRNDKEWQKLYFLTLAGLDRPSDAAAFLQELKGQSEELSLKLKLILDREGFARTYPAFKPDATSTAIPKEIAKKAISIAQGRDSLYMLTPLALYDISSSGAIISTLPISGGKELLMKEDGECLVLAANSIISASRTILLPLAVTSAVSFAGAPGGCFYILDSTGKVFLTDEGGRILEERQTRIPKPSRIRTDELFRVFIFSSGEKDISIYSASFSPLTVLSPEIQAQGISVGRISDFEVDFAGNSLLLDKSRRELLFFNFQKNFLGKSNDTIVCVDLFYWNGKDSLIALDAKKAKIMKVLL